MESLPRRAPGVLLQRLSGPLSTLLTCGIARHGADGVIDLHVNDEEVATGGMITISMYVPVRGSTREELFSAWLALRPGMAEGTILEPSVLLPGMMQKVSFRVRR